jgi:hypothetical protein
MFLLEKLEKSRLNLGLLAATRSSWVTMLLSSLVMFGKWWMTISL